jgi:hypothetical protein
LDLGRQVATGFKESDTKATWGLGLYLKLEERPSSGLDRRPPNWNGKIIEIELSAACLQFDLTAITSSSARPAELGTWQPN